VFLFAEMAFLLISLLENVSNALSLQSTNADLLQNIFPAIKITFWIEKVHLVFLHAPNLPSITIILKNVSSAMKAAPLVTGLNPGIV
jgi:hypothetical protein